MRYLTIFDYQTKGSQIFMENYNNIIAVANDFSHESFIAIEHAAVLAQKDNSELLIIHVLNKETKSKLEETHKTPEHIRQLLTEQAEKVKQIYGVNSQIATPEGEIFTAIGDTTAEYKAKFLVMGTHGIQSLGERLLGSWALRIVDSSPVPVLIVQNKGAKSEGYKRILMELTNAEQCRRLLPHAVNFYKVMGSEIVLFEDYEEDEYIKNEIARNKTVAQQYLEKNGVPYTMAIQSKGSSYYKDMTQYAAANGVDLIMIVASKDRGFIEMVTEPEQKVIYNKEEIPVLCISAVETTIMGDFMDDNW